MELQLYDEVIRLNEALTGRRAARTVQFSTELSRRTPLDRIAYVPSSDLDLDSDQIDGGIGADLIAGDRTIIATPLVQTTPADLVEQRLLDRHVELLLDQLAEQDRIDAPTSFDMHIGRTVLASSTTDAMSPASRHGAIEGTWTVGEDAIEGSDGNDILMGDRVAIVSPLMIDQPSNSVSLRRSAYDIRFLDNAMRTFLDNPALAGVDVHLRGDTIDGGEDDDVLMGSVGDDQLFGRNGNDTVLGGNGQDIVHGNAGVNRVRDDGGDYALLDLQEAMGTARFGTTTPTTHQLLLDAAAGATMPVTWSVDNSGTATDAGNGDPDTQAPPTPRMLTVNGNTQAVVGQPIILTGVIDDLPGGATSRILWEVVDSTDTVIQAGTGDQFRFVPTTPGSFQVNATSTDNANGAGLSTTNVTVVDSQLIADTSNPGMMILVIGATDESDDIRLLDVRHQPNSVEVRQRSGRNPFTRTTYNNISRVDVYGGEGDDDVAADRRLAIPVRLYGGAGNDKLRGGAANDYLDGGAGDDQLNGESGDDVLIGNWGADRMNAGRGDDLLISDAFSPVAGTSDADALLARWSDSTDTVADRMADLIGDLSAAISNDGAVDSLYGDRGIDSLFAQSSDNVRLRRNDDDLTHLF